MPEIKANIKICCGTCGAVLCNQTLVATLVEACEKCLAVARAEGYTEGYEKARLTYKDT
ncbi:MAG: hypothetical protein KKB31_07790 [Nanoarchaeota archaeon]|nr:hypothetical protein [Nanoarchaeota archaeon]